MGLYQKALGADFEDLGAALKRFHSGSNRSIGRLTVSHSTQFIPKLFIWLMKLPKAGSDLETSLEVEQVGDQEEWRRQIGTTRLTTKQRLRDGKLIEIAGPLVFEFDVAELGGAMVLHTYRSRFLGIPLPKGIAPIIDAKTEPFEGGWGVTVSILCPRYGTICCYAGKVWLA